MKFFFASLILCFAACAPKVQNRQFETPKTNFGPNLNDVDLRKGLQETSDYKASLSWQGDIATAEFFRQADNILALGQLNGSQVLTDKASEWVQTYYSTEKSTSLVNFADSPYIVAAAAQTQDDVLPAVGEIRSDLSDARNILKNKIAALGKSFAWPRGSIPLAKDLQSAETFLNQFGVALPTLKLSDLITQALQKALKEQSSVLLDPAKEMVTKLYATAQFSQALGLVQTAVTQFGFTVPASLQKSLAQGKVLGQELDSYKDEQGALTVIIDVWTMLNAQQRIQYIQPVNSDLYNFLNGATPKELGCLRLPDCDAGIIDGIKKKLFVLPKLKKYGLETLRTQLNQKAVSYVMTTIEAFGNQYLLQLPDVLADRVDQGLVSNDQELKQIQTSYRGFLQSLVKPWSLQKMSSTQGQIAGFENSKLIVNFAEKSPLGLKPSGDLTQVSAETTGAAMAAVGAVLDLPSISDDFVFRTSLSELNKLLVIGGYWDDQKKLTPAFYSPLSNPQNSLDLMTFTSSSESYAAPDILPLKSPFVKTDGAAKNFSAKALAEQIRGLSRMVGYTRDWKKSRFDDVLGKIQAQDLTTEYQADALQRSFFPKTMLIALNLGDVAVLLKNLTKEFSQVFLLNAQKKIIWANDYDFNGTDTAVMAGVVDLNNGIRATTVKTQDVAMLVLAIQEFINATEGVENSTSPYLTQPDSSGDTPIKSLQEGRDELRLLTLALANFISNQLLLPNGLVASTYDLQSFAPNTKAVVLDQAFAIRALVAAREVTHTDIYLWSAEEIYFSMNRNLFDRTQRFYLNPDKSSLGFAEKVTTMRALSELHPYLPMDSQDQLDWVLRPWLRALSALP